MTSQAPDNRKSEIALAEIDRVIAAGVRFGCVVADAGYGLSARFRQGKHLSVLSGFLPDGVLALIAERSPSFPAKETRRLERPSSWDF
jgi:SRSO17 transposase